VSKHRPDDDPIGDYIEQTGHLYRVGRSGGNLPRNFKEWLTAKDRRSVAVSLVICAIVVCAGLLAEFRSAGPLTRGEVIAAMVVSGLIGLGAIGVFRAARRQAASEHQKP
jgi:hypothetical protein